MFSWTDEETALLMKVALDYKTMKLVEGKDWETIPLKYDDIKEISSERYQNEATEEIPRGSNAKDELTKDRINSKVKKIKNSFRKAVDSGKRSGGGKLLALCTRKALKYGQARLQQSASMVESNQPPSTMPVKTRKVETKGIWLSFHFLKHPVVQ